MSAMPETHGPRVYRGLNLKEGMGWIAASPRSRRSW